MQLLPQVNKPILVNCLLLISSNSSQNYLQKEQDFVVNVFVCACLKKKTSLYGGSKEDTFF